MLETDFDMNVDVELEDISEGLPQNIDEFMEKKFFFSYSSKKLLLFDPPAFKEKYINKQEEERLDKHLIYGKLIHCLILEPDTFPENFIVSPLTVPTGKNREIVHSIYKKHLASGQESRVKFFNYSEDILAELVRLDLHQSLVNDKKDLELTGDAKRLVKMLTEENSLYFDYMLTRGKKNVIDAEMVDYCTKAALVITENPQFRKLMGIGADPATNEVINEQLYFLKLKDYAFGLKGIIDNINIDHVEKIIYVNDFKTTGRDLSLFPEAVEAFKYSDQAVIYLQLIAGNFKTLVYDKAYKVEFRFITIDKKFKSYAFKISDASLEKWRVESAQRLVEANYHYTQRDYTLPFAFATGSVEL